MTETPLTTAEKDKIAEMVHLINTDGYNAAVRAMTPTEVRAELAAQIPQLIANANAEIGHVQSDIVNLQTRLAKRQASLAILSA